MKTQHSAGAVPVVSAMAQVADWPATEHEVGMTEAREKIGRFLRAFPEQVHAGAVTRDALEILLGQNGCTGVRMYYGLTAEGTLTLVLVGTDEAGNDLDEGVLMDRVYPCPPFCAVDSALNS